ncbi:DUF4253 domain-containing protein [Actinomadura rupiterrae]|uniref:DUF4253 domain-containing protein n=1 Tax=Actinomadura rupiterrae TaxID=559627 RepID=UPI0020A247F3|nr:DUF4253 domain-containing protein [Actinomadura rupiterrae]MCP2339849.1 hypothetical protein [Actinomadura rupiterrae]
MTEHPPFASLPDYLPAGRLIEPDPDFLGEGRSPSPVLWISDEPPADAFELWERLRDDHPDTGLFPLLLDSSGDRPWQVGELNPHSPTEIDAIDVEKLLRDWWDDSEPWQGLAAASAPEWDPDEANAESVDIMLDVNALRVGLVPAANGPDALTAVGWDGPCNHASTPEISAVLRSWSDRFGARIARVGFDTLSLTVANPPSTPEHARAVAAEHHAFCPDNINQGEHDFDAYADHLQNLTVWHFWWD